MWKNKFKLFAEFRRQGNKNTHSVWLQFSLLHFLSGNPRWFCRIYAKNWVANLKNIKTIFGQSYGKTKFEAYRKAIKDLYAE